MKASEQRAAARKLGPLAESVWLSVEANRRALDREENAKADEFDAAEKSAERDAIQTLERAGHKHAAHVAFLRATNRHLEADLYSQAHSGDLKNEEGLPPSAA